MRNLQNRTRETCETILVVDDDEGVRKAVVALLENAGFNVISADSGASAIELAGETDEEIDLLLSDVDMEKMSGPDLGEVLKAMRPGMHVMLMSGGKDGNLLVLNYGWAFVQKPFVPKKLVQMIRDVLHSENRSQLGGQEFDTRKDIKSRNGHKGRDAEADIHPPNSNEPKDRGIEQ
jgi:DNA-binding NtrC family response regulator